MCNAAGAYPATELKYRANQDKPSNTFLAVAGEFLATSGNAHAVVMHTSLPEFVVSCLKKENSGIVPWQRMHAALDPESVDALPVDASSTPMQWACVVWHYQMRLLARLAGTPSAARMRHLSAQDLLDNPEENVSATQRWLAPELSGGPDSSRIRDELRRHAKTPASSFDPARRRAETALAYRHFGNAIRDTLAWSDKMLGSWEAAYDRGPRSLRKL